MPSSSLRTMLTWEQFAHKMPKVELHAHLNGSLSTAGILELGQFLYGEHTPEFLQLSRKFTDFDGLNLNDCFQKFQFMHQLTATRSGLEHATQLVLQQFAAENVIHLELRTTPKANEHMTKREYLECVLNVLRGSREKLGMSVKLLPSIDRSKNIDEAVEMLHVVQELCKTHHELITGIDLSGNPHCGQFADFIPLLGEARSGGLKLTLHCAEIDNAAEVEQMLQFGMERCGHGTFLSSEQVEWLGQRNVAIECCLTSNVKSGTVPGYADHHFRRIFEAKRTPAVLCTDDCGVFETTLANEFTRAKQTFNLQRDDVRQLTVNAIEHAFIKEQERTRLRGVVEEFFKLYEYTE